MRKFINILILTIALVGSVSAQSLDDLSKKVYDASIEIINKGMNAYEEQLEKQELEEAKKAEEERKAEEEYLEKQKLEEEKDFEENCELLKASAIDYSIEHKVWIKCYYYPFKDYIWYILFVGDDGDLWINLRYDDNGELGDLFYSTKNERLDYTKAIDDMGGKVSAAIKLTSINNKYIIFMQDFYDPNDFTMTYIE